MQETLCIASWVSSDVKCLRKREIIVSSLFSSLAEVVGDFGVPHVGSTAAPPNNKNLIGVVKVGNHELPMDSLLNSRTTLKIAEAKLSIGLLMSSHEQWPFGGSDSTIIASAGIKS
ncbi:unnamed protein product [Gordionus sp. m RMFG-2023]